MRLTAAAEERERLSLEVHDGVLQVLSYIKRRGSEIGGPTEELALRAGEQEVALRVLITEQADHRDVGGAEVDLRPLLTAQSTPTVSVSTPGDPVRVGRWMANEIASAVATALSNVALHAGDFRMRRVLISRVLRLHHRMAGRAAELRAVHVFHGPVGEVGAYQ